MSDNQKIGLGIFAVCLIIFLAVWIPMSLFTVGYGEVGVRFDPFGGGVSVKEYSQGMHLKAPWVKISKFNVRTQDYTMSMIAEEGNIQRDDRIACITNEGLRVDLDITVLYSAVANKCDEILSTVGADGDYQAIVVRPTIRSVIRNVVSNHDAAYIYSETRGAVEQEIFDTMSPMLAEYNINVEKVLLRAVVLPQLLTQAIDEKKQAEQQFLRMQYILDTAEKEAERKVIEAGGIAEANKIIGKSLTEEYLSWYWLENLKNHSNVVYIIPSESGLPIFKDIDTLPDDTGE